MSDFNQLHNRAVWFDIPVVDLDRATKFYANVLGVAVTKETFDDFHFAVIEHKDGNGGCLIPNPDDVTEKGIMLYLNVEGRLHDAVSKVQDFGGNVTQAVHAIGPHGFRAIVVDCEGNRIVLHSMSGDQTAGSESSNG